MIAYLGGPEVKLSSVVLEPEHSLLVQSYAPKEMVSGVVNADGFGAGWYAPQIDEKPAVYRSNGPLWSDRSFAGISSKIGASSIFAAVRSATPGLPAEESGVPPFASGRFMFMHNGAIKDFRRTAMRPLRDALSDESYAGLLGTTDSETIFALLLDRLREEPGDLAGAVVETVRHVSEVCYKLGIWATLNVSATDGETMVFTRYSTEGPENSLYFVEDGEAFPEAVVVASERLDRDTGWTEVPDRHLLVVGRNDGAALRPLQEDNRRTNRVSGTVRVSTLYEERGDDERQMARDVRAGLMSSPKDLSAWPKYLYDAEGSRLFEQITELPEYYQTRTELSILKEKAREIVSRAGCREVVELGSGSASKTRILLDAMLESYASDGGSNDRPARYVPLDVSESALRESGELLLEEYPELEILGYVGDFERSLDALLGDLARVDGKDGGRLVVLLGGTIGNFTPERRRSFLDELRAGLNPGDHLLIGMDLVKDRKLLEAAYDDGAGVTARFNKNLLKVLNRRLRGGFDLDLFLHRARYDAEKARIEMWLCSTVDQEVYLADPDLKVRFSVGEGMRTEISAKFTPGSIRQTFDESGLDLLDLYTDERNLFGLAFGRVGA